MTTLDQRPAAPLVGRLPDVLERRAALRRMKSFALALLLAAVVVYALTHLAEDGERGWVGFVRAAAEAGVVGGLADWFAVTALFRRPMGLPIPHTALIPTRKDALAGTLGEFVTGNFVTPDNLRLHLADARVVPRVGAWLASPGVADRLTRELLSTAGAARRLLRPEVVADVLLDIARRDTARRSYAELAGSLLEELTDGGVHRPLVDAALPYVRSSLAANRPAVVDFVKEVLERRLLGWLVATDKRIGHYLDGLDEALGEMQDNPDHPFRQALDSLVHELATGLQQDPALRTRVDSFVLAFLADPATRAWWVRLAEGALGAVEAAVEDPDGAFSGSVSSGLAGLGRRTTSDPAFAARLERRLEGAVLWAVENYAQELTTLIERTVKGWDGADAADKIELAAGRDLQFIRINGTVVGALAGLALHMGAVLLS